ncbi:hypothetical protein V6Z11_D03G176100 [Gossypium hirsutum]|uniref:Uncharacterized protein n=2 Tax=Gossypium TaxID=3633 RepID=A0A1U8LNF3_GOSHI|nr:uncharacterized protein LOC107929227 [Gossypium hirsutum]PPD97696.1 hypothetical protein GOBAR_DD05299 [Gossypium barbadense]
MGELGFQQRWELRRNEGDGLDSSFDNMKSIGNAKRCKTREGVDLNRNETSDHVADPLDELKNLMESLLKDLKVTKQDLLKWMLEEMKKLISDYTRPEPKKRKRGHGGMKKAKKVEDQHEKHPNNIEKSIQVQHRMNLSRDRVESGQVNELQGHKSFILAIEAQKGTTKGKKAVDRNNCRHQVAEGQGKMIGTNGDKFGSSVARNFLHSLSGQPTEPIVTNQGLDASSLYNYMSPNQGSFQALMGSKNMGSINQTSPSSSSIGSGFGVPFHQAIDVVGSSMNPQCVTKDNGKAVSLMMNNGGGSYNLSQLIASNNHHCFMSYQMQNIKDGNLFRQ